MASFDGLGRMKALLEALGSPEAGLKAIHIAGTNGKGSTAVMTASILEEAGFSAGLYTSPHLETECERIQLWDGVHRMIEQSELDELRERVRAAGAALEKEHGRLTMFEVYTAAAYLWFEEKKPDYVVLETGLGGRLDSTNTLEKPLVSVITSVGLDHTRELGNTIFRIAHEKAGIIKDGVPVVSQTADLAVKNIVSRTAEEHECSFTDVTSAAGTVRSLVPELPMYGGHQILNAMTAIAALKAAGIEVSDEAVTEGLSNAVLPGRFEILAPEEADGGGEGSAAPAYPLFVIDGAHNPDAIGALTEAYMSFARSHKIKRTMVIFGCMQDKNSVRMLQLLTGGLKGCSYTATAVDYDRAEDPERIGEIIASLGRGCTVTGSVREAYELAKGSGFECVLVTGSIYLAGEMRSLLMHDCLSDN